MIKAQSTVGVIIPRRRASDRETVS